MSEKSLIGTSLQLWPGGGGGATSPPVGIQCFNWLKQKGKTHTHTHTHTHTLTPQIQMRTRASIESIQIPILAACQIFALEVILNTALCL